MPTLLYNILNLHSHYHYNNKLLSFLKKPFTTIQIHNHLNINKKNNSTNKINKKQINI